MMRSLSERLLGFKTDEKKAIENPANNQVQMQVVHVHINQTNNISSSSCDEGYYHYVKPSYRYK